MAYKIIEGGSITSPKGYLAGACYVGVKSRKSEKPDVAILYSQEPASCAALFTTNKFCAAPVLLGREVLKKGKARAVVINSGNANAATGQQGLENAKKVEVLAEELLGLGEDEVFVSSTGVIGQQLPVEKVLEGVRRIVPTLSVEQGTDAAWAIMTTDLVKKEVAYELELSGGTIRIGAMCKGSGMIHPNMATTLIYVTTDAKVDSALLQPMLKAAADKSFHMLTVDGDTSTNDSLFLFANGASGVAIESEADRAAFSALLDDICIDMARRIASDGEGATHLMIVEAKGLPTEQDARTVARSIAGSTLFKAALFGRDANWGRIMAAAGYSGADVDPTKADCILKSDAGEVAVMENGFGADFSEELAKKVLTEHDVTVIVDFHSGDGQATAFGCDLTYDYVKINGDYRS
ncbi:MAG: bifunctional glutamate N-acetyltransferase/amino-acid acetyltransferase ArgJ [Lawsonibacter sp.]|jgi:glutamate N-acetyltransferase/amino-acid N-acetyltransferase|nr:bifunctional glutamate N-acetyltransferase/amino-acid acetyltransferase ArgJ [Lawsonibacter sp.]MCI9566940.1 bifunctional glutamate N-acetyltransferase/amino-acid acetyltransferase ArgJ [Lawsonibacter sp.]